MATQTKRGRASKPVMDYSKLAKQAKVEDEPLSASRKREQNPFIDNVKASVEQEKAYRFADLPNETAAKQVVSLLSRAAEQLDYGMSTRIEKYREENAEGRKVGPQLWRVRWQASAKRIRRPRKDAETDETSDESTDES